MNKLLIGGAAAAALLALAPALAQTPAPAPVAPMAPMAHHGMMMKTHSRAEVAGHVQAMFAKIDANRDGSITKAEADAMHGKRHEKMGDHHARAFEQVDTNRDGGISRAEWDAHHVQGGERMGMGHEGGMKGGMRGMGKSGMGGRMFEQADANRDGRVTMQEATTAALSHFDMADTNRDGQLTPDERKAMHQRMRGAKQPG